MQQVVVDITQQNIEMREMILELCKNGAMQINQTNTTNNNTNNSHNNNKTFNLQFFLNDTCKNAINLSEFIDSIVLQMSDLENIGNVGFVEGVSNIIVSKLALLGETVRPIHCTDLKRETMYVRDDDKWEKDESKKKMKHLIRKMEMKLAPLLCNFHQKMRERSLSDSEAIQHQKIICNVLGGEDDSKNEEDITQQVAKNTTIKKNTIECYNN